MKSENDIVAPSPLRHIRPNDTIIGDVRNKVTKEEILYAIPGSKGLLLPIEIALKCTRRALKEAIEQNPDIEEALKDEAERENDRIEFNLMQDAGNGDAKSRDLFAKSRLKDRGYGEKTETLPNGPLVVLHAVTGIPTVSDWANKAMDYAERQKQVIDAELAKLPENTSSLEGS